jgi:uncharacterized protein (DUF488 family)
VEDVRQARLFTVGYEGRSATGVIDLLHKERIQVLVDVRAVPLSRKPDFRKNVWAGILDSAGIEYYSAISFGTPRHLRDRLAEDRDYRAFFRDYRRHLRSQREPMYDLVQLVDEKRIALMCFERDAMTCHRSAVADRLGVLAGLTPVHLGSPAAANAMAARDR